MLNSMEKIVPFFLIAYMNIVQPENLLLDSFGVLKVSDFGLSTFSPQIRVRTVFLKHVFNFCLVC